ncbi:MAG: hypothetical protein FWC70_00905 [Defluviitaleaceae bacterium]|nr:hypothetical protein [Defluviitaleaceae bacterium]
MGIIFLLLSLLCAEYTVVTVAGTGSSGYTCNQFTQPMGVFSGENGDLYVLDTYNNLIRRIDSSGEIHRVAGDTLMRDEAGFQQGFFRDGDSALFNRPTSAVRASDGRIFIADRSNHAIRVIYDGYVFTFAGGNGAGYENGTDAMFFYPSALALSADGNIYVADTGNNVIRRIDTFGYVTTVAGIAGESGYCNDSALFNHPMGIAVSEDGIIFVADSGNHLIRFINDDRVGTLAGFYQRPEDAENTWEYQPTGGFANGYDAMFNLPAGLALRNEYLIVADSANHAIRAIHLPTAEVFTIAGEYPGYADGVLNEARFHFPHDVYVSGDALIIADTGNNMVRKITLEMRIKPLIRVTEECYEEAICTVSEPVRSVKFGRCYRTCRLHRKPSYFGAN